jgi:4-methylaminobutanoate oxidase (formaldehyde-forming)
MLLNGPESFTGDGNFILGEAPSLAGYFVCAGFNSAGIANSGGAGKLVAQWIVDGEAPLDLWDVDIRRFAPFHSNRRHLADRTVESLGLHYAMRWPREELKTVRPLRRSPLYDRLAAKRAVFGSKLGWERANYFLPPGATEPAPTLGTPGWLPWVLDEQRACREDCVVFDQSSFAKAVLKGRDALAVLQRLCANELDVPPGRMVYTAMLNARGGFESDLTVLRVAEREFFVLTGSAQATRDFSRIERHIAPGEHAALVDVSGAWSVISVMGPKAQALLESLSPDKLGKDALPFSHVATIDVGYARVRAARMSYVGGPGYELYVPVEQCATLYDALCDAGPGFGLRDAGYYTIDALRIEAGRAPGAPSCRPTRRRGKRGSATRSSSTSPRPSSDASARREARCRPAQAAGHADVRRPGRVPVGRRADPDGRPQRRRDHQRRLQPQARARRRDGLRARGDAADRRGGPDARYVVDIAGATFAVTPHLKPPTS